MATGFYDPISPSFLAFSARILCMKNVLLSSSLKGRFGVLRRTFLDLLDAISRTMGEIIIFQLTDLIGRKRVNRSPRHDPTKFSFSFHETTEHNRKKLFQWKTPSQLEFHHKEMKAKIFSAAEGEDYWEWGTQLFYCFCLWAGISRGIINKLERPRLAFPIILSFHLQIQARPIKAFI